MVAVRRHIVSEQCRSSASSFASVAVFVRGLSQTVIAHGCICLSSTYVTIDGSFYDNSDHAIESTKSKMHALFGQYMSCIMPGLSTDPQRRHGEGVALEYCCNFVCRLSSKPPGRRPRIPYAVCLIHLTLTTSMKFCQVLFLTIHKSQMADH
jgi:hypothetical protein